MNEAEKLFTRAAHTSWHGFSNILDFRSVAALGRSAATFRIYEESVRIANELFTDPQYASMFLDRKAALDALDPIGGIGGMGREMAENRMKNFQKVIDAASLIFAHSLLDGVALDYCRVTALLSSSSWEQFVDQREVKIRHIRGQTFDAILWSKIEEYLKTLDREPLLTKIDRLLAVCQPPRSFAPIRGYKFDRDQLVTLDKNRHDVVHKSDLADPLPRGDDDVWFFLNTSNYLMSIVNQRFDVKLDPAGVLGVTERG